MVVKNKILGSVSAKNSTEALKKARKLYPRVGVKVRFYYKDKSSNEYTILKT